MKIIKNTGVILALFVVFGCSVANAEMFKCIGKNGKATYQATKCQTGAAVSVIKPADKVKTTDDKIAESKALMEKKTAENDANFDTKILVAKKNNLPTSQLEREKLIAKRDILLEYQKTQKEVVDDLKAEEKKHRDNAAAAQQEIINLRKTGAEKLREIERAGM
jgi:hypothetical protein